MKHSKLQLQVLSLYKECMRAAQLKPGFEQTVRTEFKRNAALPRSDTLRIEYAMRNGQRKLEMMRDPRVSGMGRFVDEQKK